MEGGWRGSFYSYIPLRQIFLNSFHITYQFFFLFGSSARAPNPHTKDYRKSGKTKLITQGISTSQCCLKCNYMGLELWLWMVVAANLSLADMFPI